MNGVKPEEKVENLTGDRHLQEAATMNHISPVQPSIAE